MLQCKVHAGRIHPARASPPLPALSCTRQGSFRGLTGEGGRRIQETPLPPPGVPLSARTRSADEALEVRSPQSRLPRRRSLQAAACAHHAKQSSSPLIQVSASHTGAAPPVGIAAIALSPCIQATGEAAAAHALCSRARRCCVFAAATALLLICSADTASQVLQTPQPLDRSCVLVATCAQTMRVRVLLLRALHMCMLCCLCLQC